MAVIKITQKAYLDTLIAKITLRLGRKPTQQEVLDYCIILGHDHIDDIVSQLTPVPIIDDDKIDAIIKIREECARAIWIPTAKGKFINQDDKDVYTL